MHVRQPAAADAGLRCLRAWEGIFFARALGGGWEQGGRACTCGEWHGFFLSPTCMVAAWERKKRGLCWRRVSDSHRRASASAHM